MARTISARGYDFPVSSSRGIRNLPTYSLFYRNRKDVRQLKDSLDLLRGRDGADSTVDTMRRLSNTTMMVLVAMVVMADVWVDGSKQTSAPRKRWCPRARGCREDT